MRPAKWKSCIILAISTVAAGLCFLCPDQSQAEQLPLKNFTIADGLVRDSVNRIVADSRGFLWFCTPDGLSRFDGYGFVSYATEQGLPDRHVNDLLETRSGVYWVATGAGVCRFDPTGSPPSRGSAAAKPLFVPYYPAEDGAARYVNVLVEGRDGAIWCGTSRGVYRLQELNGSVVFEAVDIGLPAEPGDATMVAAMLEDRNGGWWIGTFKGLYRRLPDGQVQRYTTAQGLPDDFAQALLEDREGRLWVGTRFGGLCQIVSPPGAGSAAFVRVCARKDGLPSNWVATLFESSDGQLWAGTNVGLSELTITRTGAWHLKNYSAAEGLGDGEIWALGEDREGGLWIGTANSGAMRLARDGFTTYGTADGLDSAYVAAILEDADGGLCVISTTTQKKRLNWFTGTRFHAVRPRMGAANQKVDWGWGWNQLAVQNREGDWWLATGQGLYRYARCAPEALVGTSPKAVYTTRDGLSGNNVFRVFGGSNGDIWVGTMSDLPAVARWEQATGTFHRFSAEDGVPRDAPSAFCEDAAGNLWIGLYHGGLARYRGGRFTLFTEADGLPAGMIRALYPDQRGRLWIASSAGGLGHLDDPAAEAPTFASYTTTDGISSDDVWCVTEDRDGRIYAGTGRGLDRLDTASGRVIHFTSADGLAPGKVEEAFRDRQGTLWFGTSHGLSRLVVRQERPGAAPPVVITGLRIAGVTHRVSELGETAIADLELDSGQNDVEISFAGITFDTGNRLRYRYTLEGAKTGWSPLSDQRSISYARLSPGSYRFVVQAVAADGAISAAPATVRFTIPPPFWQRWWFLTLGAAAVALIVYAAHRRRLARLLELERVRTRIATDLHDDIGSSLSRVAILSEVVKQQIGEEARDAVPLLTEMAESSRNLVDSMSDIVWSIDPRRDELSNLAVRIRQFASDVFEASKITWEFEIPQEFDGIRLSPGQRRQLFLIFKEAINNIARHAQCDRARLNVVVDHHRLSADIRDNGRGFDAAAVGLTAPADNGGGHGLENMQRRAAQLGGYLKIESSPGNGTALKLSIPLK